ncbi:hypothetical protein GOARA_008_00440 [Gordonia araii NBRC 100433]|uniref:Type VII secretion system protein EssD-like domain-containing protein n=2 Tax=Gordonia araii TaxID=263909 RepID=G7GXL9_9ACTN|nr:hypothetical protein GOARA_008_00440 [Gordonia araii NBRC 100433]
MPGVSAQAKASSNCSTLPSRIAAHNADARNYSAQVRAINARGGGTRAQVMYYNAWRARGLARGNALANELAGCQQRGRLRNLRPPEKPGAPRYTPRRHCVSAPTDIRIPAARCHQPRRSPSPRSTNPTPGYAAPGGLSPRGIKNGLRSREGRYGDRTITSPDGGSQRYQQMMPGRGGRGTSRSASGANGVLTKGMRGTGSGTRRGPGGDKPPGFRAGCDRGHLIGSQLGGLGTDPRNIVTLDHGTNIDMRKTENEVARHVDRGIKVNYRVIPIYAHGPNRAPSSIRILAWGAGMAPIYREFQNRRCG